MSDNHEVTECSEGISILPRVSLIDNGGVKWRRYPPDVIPVWLADMDFLPPAAVRKVTTHGESLRTYVYPEESIYTDVSRAFCERMSRDFAWEPGVEQVVVLSDL